jgi:hypothetical protein
METGNTSAETRRSENDCDGNRRTKPMPNETPNSGAKTGNSGTFDSNQPEESAVAQSLFPDALLDLLIERVLRCLYRRNPELKPRPAKLRKRTVEKIYQIDPRAFQQGLELSAKLNEEFARATALIKELRSEREQILRVTKPELFT